MNIPNFVVHHHHKDRKPFLNLSDLSPEERAMQLMVLNNEFITGETLRSFPDWYMPQRLEAEKNMREQFKARGGRPLRDAPHYFTLGHSKLFEGIYKHNLSRIILRVEEFTSDEICFVVNDSLWTMALSHDPEQSFKNRWFEGSVYSYDEIVDLLRELSVQVDDPQSLAKNKISMVEAMVWSDAALKRCGAF